MGLIQKIFFKPKFYLVLLMKNQKTLHVMKVIEISGNKDTKKVGKKEYVIGIKNPTYVNYNRRYYHLDISTGFKYTFNEIEHVLNADDLDMIVGNKIIRELTAGVMDNKKELILYGVVGAILGLLLGVLIMNLYMQTKIEELYKELVDSNDDIVIFSSMVKMLLFKRW